MRGPRQKFAESKYDARRRGVVFLLTFDQWLSIWKRSGKWTRRSNRRGGYCMARFGDRGPYAVGNVKIILHSDNVSEAQVGRRKSKATRRRMGAWVRSEKTKRRIATGVRRAIKRRLS